MKIVVQRVKKAACYVENKLVSEIKQGFCLFVSFKKGDDASLIPWMAKKIANLRVFEDDEGKMNRSLLDNQYDVLSISQFTLEGKTKKGNRPSFSEALDPKKANELYEQFNTALKDKGLNVYPGVFQAHMDIHIINDGPVTLIVERENSDD